MHKRGDNWSYWEDLDKAESYFNRLYTLSTGKSPHTREAFGVIRYGLLWDWIQTREDKRLFRECLIRTVKKFPHLALELTTDALHVLEDDLFRGFCKGIAFIKSLESKGKK